MEPSVLLQKFIERSPIPVMVRALLERVPSPERLDGCFARASKKQYTRELLAGIADAGGYFICRHHKQIPVITRHTQTGQ